MAVGRVPVAASLEPGATVHAVAQRHGPNTSQLFTWRKQFRTQPSVPAAPGLLPAFAAVEVAPVLCPPEESGAAGHGRTPCCLVA